MADRKQQVTIALSKFYQNPVAKVSLELFLTIGLVLFLGVFAIRPTLLTMTDLIKEIEEKRELNEQLSQKVAALSSAQTEFQTKQNQLVYLDQAVPSQPKLLQNLKIIEKIATENEVIIKSLSVPTVPEDNPDNPDFAQLQQVSLPMTISLTGSYPSIRNFVEDMINNRREFVVNSVTFSLQENRGDTSLNANVTVLTPYFGIYDPIQNEEDE